MSQVVVVSGSSSQWGLLQDGAKFFILSKCCNATLDGVFTIECSSCGKLLGGKQDDDAGWWNVDIDLEDPFWQDLDEIGTHRELNAWINAWLSPLEYTLELKWN